MLLFVSKLHNEHLFYNNTLTSYFNMLSVKINYKYIIGIVHYKLHTFTNRYGLRIIHLALIIWPIIYYLNFI